MAYKAFKELFQNRAPVDTCSQRVKDWGDGEGEGRMSFKTSLKDRIAFLDLRETRLKSGATALPTSFQGSISLPALRSDAKTTPGRDTGFHDLHPCSRTRSKDENSQRCGGEDVRCFGPEKRKYEATETERAVLDSFAISGAPSTTASSVSRRVKPRRAVTLPVTDVEKVSVGDKEDDLGDEIEDTQSLIHALEDENEVKIIEEQPENAYEPLVLWPPLGERSSTPSAEVETVEVPGSINSRLLEHQLEGVRFLYRLYRNNHGGILGDDMGLGKTIQSIAFLAAILGKKDTDLRQYVGQKGLCEKVVLIICPNSVLKNWDQEIAGWGDFRVGTYFGPQREVVLDRIYSNAIEIVLTTHDTYRIHGDELCKVKWDCVIVDEAHRLKNDKSGLYIMCMKLPTKRRYGLTGTVMQNTYMELFNVFEWATPGCLGSRDHFKDYYSGPIKEGQRITAPRRFQVIAEERQKHLLVLLREYFLRRTKQQTIAHLMSGKEDNVIFCPMTPVQKRVYKRVLQSPDYQALMDKALPCTCGSPLKRGQCCYRIVPNGAIWSYQHKDSPDDGCDSCPNCLMFPCLNKLRQVSNHLELIKPNPKDDESKQANDYKFAKMALGDDADLVGGVYQETNFLGMSDAQHCGKMLALEELLSSWIPEGDKVLLFSHSVKMLDIIDKFLIRKGYCFCRLDGSTPMSARQSLVDDFNTSPSKQIFLISTRAGGLGLNLVSANRVLIFDPDWNPSNDLQAQDRSFRFGQVRHVTVYRLLTAGSLEELVYTRQIYKQQLFNVVVSGAYEKRYFEGVQGSKEHKGELFGMENLLRDLSDVVFAEGIIEDHEERLLRIERANQDQDIAHVETFGLEEVEGFQGDVTCLDEMGPGITRPVDSDQYLEDKSAEDDEKERKVQRRVHAALTSAGVLYAHRNEDVVNLGSSRFGYSSRSVSGAELPREPKVLKDIPEKRKQKQQTQTEKHQHLQKAGKSKTKKSSVVRQEVKVMAGSSARHPSAPSSSEDSKKELQAELAKFKGLDIMEFSKWYMSSTKEDREQLRLDHQIWREKFPNG